MANQSEPKALKFTCPSCKKVTRLLSVEQPIIAYPITRISSDGDLDYDFDAVDNDYGDSQVLNYACADCGFIPEKGGEMIGNCDDLAKWVAENCPQD